MHDREYEAYPKAAYLKDILATRHKFESYFNKAWRAYVTPANIILPGADPEAEIWSGKLIECPATLEENYNTCAE